MWYKIFRIFEHTENNNSETDAEFGQGINKSSETFYI